MKKFSRLVALALATVMTLTACGTTDTPVAQESTPAASTTETVKADEPQEIVEISVMVFDRGHEYTNGNSLTDNEFTRWVNEQMEPQGVHVNYIPVPRSGADDKINLMLTGGTAPDVIRTYDRQRVATYASQGGLMDLAPYVDTLDATYLEKAEPYLESCQFDGGQYALPGVYSYTGKSHETFLRQDLVEGAGKEMPTNKEELIDVLYAIKDKYPEITPYGFGGKITDGNYTNFILSYTSRANERENYIYEPTFTRILKPGHKDGLRQLNQFVLDGIIDANFVTDTDNAKYEENVYNGKYAFIMDGSDDCICEAYETSGIEGYHMVEGDFLEDLDGSYAVPSQGAFDFYMYVPATAEPRIDAVVKYLQFLSVEANSVEVRNGIEGLGYDLVDGQVVGRNRADRIAAGTSSNPSDNSMLWGNFDMTLDELIAEYTLEEPEVPAEVCESKIRSQYSNYYHTALIGGALKSDEYVPLLQELIVEFVFKCMLAPEGQFDAVYEKEYQILLDNHLQDVLDERAAWYDANIAK